MMVAVMIVTINANWNALNAHKAYVQNVIQEDGL